MKKMTLMSDNNGKNIIEILILVIGLGVVVYLALDMMKPKETKEPVNNNAISNQNKDDEQKDYSYLKSLDDSKYLKKQADGTYKATIDLENYKDAMGEYSVITGWGGIDSSTGYSSPEEMQNHTLQTGQIEYNVNIKLDDGTLIMKLTNTKSTYGLTLNSEYSEFGKPTFTILDNKYVVVTGASGTTGPNIINMKIFDSKGNVVTSVNKISKLDFDQGNKLNEIKYTVCDGDPYKTDSKWTKTNYQVKYDTNNKTITTNKLDEKTIDDYMYCAD